MDNVNNAAVSAKPETVQDKVRKVEHFLAVEVAEKAVQKSILEGVGAVAMDGMPKGSRKSEDGATMQYEELCEELRAVHAVIASLTGTTKAICQGVLDGKSDINIYQSIGYSRSYYYHKLKRDAMLTFAGRYWLREF